MLVSLGDHARALVSPGGLKGRRISSPVSTFQTFTVSLPSAEAIRMLSEDQARASTLWFCVAKRAGTLLWRGGSSISGVMTGVETKMMLPVLASQTCTELSR